MNYYCEHNICPLSTDLPAKTDTVTLNRDVHFEQIAHILGISIEQLQNLNPQYRQNLVNGQAQPATLRLPASLVNVFIDKEDSVYAYNPKSYKPKRTVVNINDGAAYVVNNNKVNRIPKDDQKSVTAKNETNIIDGISTETDNKASRYSIRHINDTEKTLKNDTTVSTTNSNNKSIKEEENYNRSSTASNNSSKRGHDSRRKDNSSKSAKKSNKKKTKSQSAKHVTVKNGDTLSEIAERNHTSVKQLRQLNGIKGSNIVIGKKIRVK